MSGFGGSSPAKDFGRNETSAADREVKQFLDRSLDLLRTASTKGDFDEIKICFLNALDSAGNDGKIKGKIHRWWCLARAVEGNAFEAERNVAKAFELDSYTRRLVKDKALLRDFRVELHNMHFFKYRGLKGYAVERQFSQFFKNSCFC